MKILSLRVENFKKFDQSVTVEGFGDGLNLIAGPNEIGKSTLLLALRAALFERHGTKSQSVKDFSPHKVSGARPTIAVDFEVEGKRYHLEKVFLKRPSATLTCPDGRRFEGSDAENELKRLLGLSSSEKTSAGKDSPAHFGVLLTPQTKSFQQPDLADGTRHTLEAAIADEIADLGSQSEVDGLLAEFDAMLFDFVSKRGEPKNRYADVTKRLAEVERDLGEATAEREGLEDQFARLERALAERRALQAAASQDKVADRLAEMEAARAQAARLQTLENRRLIASQHLQAAKTKRSARQTRLEERQRLTAEIDAIAKTGDAAKNQLGMIEETLSKREEKLLSLCERKQAASHRKRDLEALGQQFERFSQIEATLSALATDVHIELEEKALDRVRLDGEPAAGAREFRQVTEGLSIEIEGVGRIGIEPKIEPMREALAAKAETESEIEKLVKALGLEDAEREAIEAAWQTVASELEALEVARVETETLCAEERRQAADAKAALNASEDRKVHLSQRLAEIEAAESGETDDLAKLNAEITDAKAAFEAADSAFQAEARRHPGPAKSEITLDHRDAQIADLRAEDEKRRRAIEDADREIIALEAAIAERSGRGLDEKIDRLERQRHLSAQERDAFALDHQALALLQSTLRAAADEAKATFNAPLARRLAPYVQQLLPEATPVVTPDFSIRALDRNGVEEPFLHLSDGTREQIAILARLAFADMLQEQGLPAFLVLDDALAFSDSQRLARMFAILEKAATRMQIIILTCREDRLGDLKATRLQIAPAPEQTSSAA